MALIFREGGTWSLLESHSWLANPELSGQNRLEFREGYFQSCGWMGPSLLEYFHVLVDMYQHGWAAGTRTQSHLILLRTHSMFQTS